MAPAQNFTMAPRGATQVTVKGKDDKRAITALLGITFKGGMIPPQLIYTGITDRCHPHYEFPDDWHITHTSSHWSDEDTMKLYVAEILIPYFERMREYYELPDDHKALLILDTFSAHCCEDFKKLLQDANICYVYVPPGCTDKLQPLDATGGVNFSFKKLITAYWEEYYQECLSFHTDENGDIPDDYDVDMRLSTLKPIHAEWIHRSFNEMKNHKEQIKESWDTVGITEALGDVFERMFE